MLQPEIRSGRLYCGGMDILDSIVYCCRLSEKESKGNIVLWNSLNC